MLNLLPIYPDELCYSYFSRLFVHSGIIYYIDIANEMFEKKNTYVEYAFINCLKKEFSKELERIIPFKILLLEHTLFKYYTLFLPPADKKKALLYALNNKPNIHPYLPIPINKTNYYLRYCPCCVEEDRNTYGECYFHTIHQIFEISVCPHHRCKLIDTNIPITKARDSKLIPLECLIKDNELKPNIVDNNNPNFLIANYIEKYLSRPYKSKQLPIGTFLTNKLDSKFFLSKRCERKDTLFLIKETKKYYKGLKHYDLSKYRIQSIYSNKYFNPWDIFLIGMFETTEEELYFRSGKIIDRAKAFDERVKLLAQTMNYQQISKLLKVDHEVIRKIVLGEYDKPKRYCPGGYSKKFDWETMDKECLKKLPMIFEKYKGERITKPMVAKELNLKDKTLRNLPLTKQELRTKRTLYNYEFDTTF